MSFYYCSAKAFFFSLPFLQLKLEAIYQSQNKLPLAKASGTGKQEPQGFSQI